MQTFCEGCAETSSDETNSTDTSTLPTNHEPMVVMDDEGYKSDNGPKDKWETVTPQMECEPANQPTGNGVIPDLGVFFAQIIMAN